MTIGQEIDGMLAKLKQQRDELKLQAHLFKAETRDDWEKVEDQWQHFQSRAKQVSNASGEVGEEIASAVRDLGHEIREGYKKIQRSL